jgi:hypothetical protein
MPEGKSLSIASLAESTVIPFPEHLGENNGQLS